MGIIKLLSMLFLILLLTFGFSNEVNWTDADKASYNALTDFFTENSDKLARVPWEWTPHVSYYNIRENLFSDSYLAIKDQDGCGTCVINAIVSAAELMVKRELVNEAGWPPSAYIPLLSVAQAMGCGGYECHGVLFDGYGPLSILDDMVFAPIRLVSETDNPTSQHAGVTFNCVSSNAWVKIKKTNKISMADAKKAIILNYPIIVTINADGLTTDIQYYNQANTIMGIGNHEVLIVGFDDNDSRGGCWLVQNSWGGNAHGGHGVFRLKYDCADLSFPRIVSRIEFDNRLADRSAFCNNIKQAWCQAIEDGPYNYLFGGYTSQTVVAANVTNYHMGSYSHFPVPTLAYAKYPGKAYLIQRKVSLPDGCTWTLAGVTGVSEKNPEFDKYPWVNLSVTEERVQVTDFIPRDRTPDRVFAKVLTFQTYVFYLSDTRREFWWPARPEDVQLYLSVHVNASIANSVCPPTANRYNEVAKP